MSASERIAQIEREIEDIVQRPGPYQKAELARMTLLLQERDFLNQPPDEVAARRAERQEAE